MTDERLFERWPRRRPTTGTSSATAAAIRRRVADHAITHVVHFTRVESLRGIICDRQIQSTRALRGRGIRALVNDHWRMDGLLDYVCCSIEYPNVILLDQYRKRHSAQDWVVLSLTPELLEWPSTRFSPVNAASREDTLSGIEGLEAMFAPCVGSPGSFQNQRRRGRFHLKNCPTDPQAEVLIRGSIPASAINGISVESDEVKLRVDPVVRTWPIDNAGGCSARPTVDVCGFLFDAKELPKHIRGYRR